MRQIVEGPFYTFGEPKLNEIAKVFRDIDKLDGMLEKIGVPSGNGTAIYRLAGIVVKDNGEDELDVLVTGYHPLLVPKFYSPNSQSIKIGNQS